METTTRKFDPTDEQLEALGAFLSGRNLVIEAGAGTGKTTTLRQLAIEARGRTGQYVAFNRAIVDEADRKMPAWVRARTMHSLAMKAVGHQFAHRLQSKRLPSAQVAKLLGIKDPVKVRIGDQAKMLAPGWLAGHVMRSIAVFCNSADPEPTRRHVPYVEGIDMPDAAGRRTYASNDLVADAIAPALARAWADLSSTHGELRYTHDHYLKFWQLHAPVIRADFVLFDEAQDASPVMADIIAQQAERAQLVYVGDSQQAIYAWRGAVNALAMIDDAERTFLTQSFRFGPRIATMANEILSQIDGAQLRLTGFDAIDSQVVNGLTDPRAILCRTNAESLKRYLGALDDDRRPYLVGEGRELVAFARAVVQLQTEGWTPHPELSIFTTWGQVQDYVDQDPQGSELALLVKLIDEYGADVITEALEYQRPEAQCDLVISTAHKAKGREWETVELAGDFPEPEDDDGLSDEELRLLYVAVTRAQEILDPSGVALLRPHIPTQAAPAPL
jgi:hypothetical protein